MRALTIPARTSLAAGAVVLLLLGGALAGVHVSLGRIHRRDTVARLQKVALQTTRCVRCQETEQAGELLAPESGRELLAEITAQLENKERVLVRVADPKGVTQYETGGFDKLLPATALPAFGDWTWQELEGPTGAHLMVFATPYPKGWVVAAWDLSPEYAVLRANRNLLLATWGVAGLLTAALVAWVTRRGMRPLARLAKHAAAIHPGTLGERLDDQAFPPELGRVVEALNGALARLETAFASHQALSADMAHELRTPLHGMRLQVEELLEAPDPPEALHGLLGTLEHLSQILDQMLFLARAEDPALDLVRRPLVGVDLVEGAVRPFAALAENRGIRLQVEMPAELAIQGDETLLRRALHNLLANALRHAQGRVVVRGDLRNEGAVLEVEDDGEGFPESLIPRLGERFLRGDTSRTRTTGGSGLGLAIVHRILHLHGGRLEVAPSAPHGAILRMILPS